MTRVLLSAFLSEKHAVTGPDVEHVIADFSEEFGEVLTAPPPIPGGDAGSVVALEKRVIGVERAVAITVNLVRQLIRTRETKADTSMKKPH